MKKLQKSLLVINMLLLSGGNSFAATDTVNSSSLSGIKYLVMGLAAIIIFLLLFLGYKIDTDNYRGVRKRRKEEKKIAKERAKEVKFEEDLIRYQRDNVDLKDINEVIEYEEDEEDDDDYDYDEEIEETVEEEDDDDTEYGEEFDTSIIDNIEDEIEETNTVETDSLMDKSKKIQEENIEVQNFSEIEELEDIENTEEDKVEEEPETIKEEVSQELDFLAQMEENLKKNQEARTIKKSRKKKEE